MPFFCVVFFHFPQYFFGVVADCLTKQTHVYTHHRCAYWPRLSPRAGRRPGPEQQEQRRHFGTPIPMHIRKPTSPLMPPRFLWCLPSLRGACCYMCSTVPLSLSGPSHTHTHTRTHGQSLLTVMRPREGRRPLTDEHFEEGSPPSRFKVRLLEAALGLDRQSPPRRPRIRLWRVLISASRSS